MDEDIWFCRASLTECELYLLLEGEEKFTEALKFVPGWAFASWEWVHLTAKLLNSLNSGVSFSPVWSWE